MESNQPRTAAEAGDAFFVRMLVKTGIKAVIWCIMAAVITYYWPHASWVWYVVIAFVAVGLLTALIGKFSAARARSQANDTPATDDERAE